MVDFLPIVTVDVFGECLFSIKAFQLACSPIQVKVELLPVVLNGAAEEDDMCLSQDRCGAKRTEFLSFIEDTSESWTPVSEASIRQSELCNGG